MPKGIYKRTKVHLLKMKANGFKKGNSGPTTDKHKKNIGKALKGNRNWDNPNSIKSQFKKGVPNNVGEDNPMYGVIGANNHRWKGGITPVNNKIRTSLEYRYWRKSIFIRDSFTCQKYGTRGGRLVAHHINNFSDFPELRFAIDNGITLSEKAHIEFHKIYGTKNNTEEQLIEFLNL